MALDVFTPVKVIQLAPQLLASVAYMFGYDSSIHEGTSMSQNANVDVAQFALRGLGGGKEGSGVQKSPKTGKAKLHELVDRGRYLPPEDTQSRSGHGSSGAFRSSQGLMEPLRIGEYETTTGSNSKPIGRIPGTPASGHKTRGQTSDPSFHSGQGGHGGSHASGGGGHSGGHVGSSHGGGSSGSEEGKELKELLRNAKSKEASASGNRPSESQTPRENTNPASQTSSTVRNGSAAAQGNGGAAGAAPVNQGGAVNVAAQGNGGGGAVAGPVNQAGAVNAGAQGNGGGAAGPVNQAGTVNAGAQINGGGIAAGPVNRGRSASVGAQGGRTAAGLVNRGRSASVGAQTAPNYVGRIVGAQVPAQGGEANASGNLNPTEGWIPGQSVPVPPLDYLNYFKSLLDDPMSDESDSSESPVNGKAPPPPNVAPPSVGDLLAEDSGKESRSLPKPKLNLPKAAKSDDGDEPSSSNNQQEVVDVEITEAIRSAADLLDLDLDAVYPKLDDALHEARRMHTKKSTPYQNVVPNLIEARKKELSRELTEDDFNALFAAHQDRIQRANRSVKELDDALNEIKNYYNARYKRGGGKKVAAKGKVASKFGADEETLTAAELDEKVKELRFKLERLDYELQYAMNDPEGISLFDRPLKDIKKEKNALLEQQSEFAERYKRQQKKERESEESASSSASPARAKILEEQRKKAEEVGQMISDKPRLIRFFNLLSSKEQQNFAQVKVQVKYEISTGAFVLDVPLNRKAAGYKDEDVPLVQVLESLTDEQADALEQAIRVRGPQNRFGDLKNPAVLFQEAGYRFPDKKKREFTEEEKLDFASKRQRDREEFLRIESEKADARKISGSPSSSKGDANVSHIGRLNLELNPSMRDLETFIGDGPSETVKRLRRDGNNGSKSGGSRHRSLGKEKDPEERGH